MPHTTQPQILAGSTGLYRMWDILGLTDARRISKARSARAFCLITRQHKPELDARYQQQLEAPKRRARSSSSYACNAIQGEARPRPLLDKNRTQVQSNKPTNRKKTETFISPTEKN